MDAGDWRLAAVVAAIFAPALIICFIRWYTENYLPSKRKQKAQDAPPAHLVREAKAREWRESTKACLIYGGWFGVGSGAFLLFLAGVSILTLVSPGWGDSDVVIEYRGTAGQYLGRVGGPNPHAARDRKISAVLATAGGPVGLLFIAAGIYLLNFAQWYDIWPPRSWSGKPLVTIEKASFKRGQRGDYAASLTFTKPLPDKKLENVSVRCVYWQGDAMPSVLEVTDPRFATNMIGDCLGQLIREEDATCGFVIELFAGIDLAARGGKRELYVPFFPAKLQKAPSYLKDAEREQRTNFVQEASTLLARGGGRLFMGIVGHTRRVPHGGLALSNTVGADLLSGEEDQAARESE